MKLRYWPELNIFVSGPPVYQRSAGVDRFWDADDVRVSADLFWTLDTRGQLGRAIRQTKRQQELQRERYKEETLALQGGDVGLDESIAFYAAIDQLCAETVEPGGVTVASARGGAAGW
jgi:hypothetical protein